MSLPPLLSFPLAIFSLPTFFVAIPTYTKKSCGPLYTQKRTSPLYLIKSCEHPSHAHTERPCWGFFDTAHSKFPGCTSSRLPDLLGFSGFPLHGELFPSSWQHHIIEALDVSPPDRRLEESLQTTVRHEQNTRHLLECLLCLFLDCVLGTVMKETSDDVVPTGEMSDPVNFFVFFDHLTVCFCSVKGMAQRRHYVTSISNMAVPAPCWR